MSVMALGVLVLLNLLHGASGKRFSTVALDFLNPKPYIPETLSLPPYTPRP